MRAPKMDEMLGDRNGKKSKSVEDNKECQRVKFERSERVYLIHACKHPQQLLMRAPLCCKDRRDVERQKKEKVEICRG
jgi:hypothetical protein